MKKVLMVVAMLFAGMVTFCYGQNVNVNINDQNVTNDDCGYKINGICSSEDIGGVEIYGLSKWLPGNEYHSYTIQNFAVLTNYHDFTVTVLVEFNPNEIHSIVLRKNETKEIFRRVIDFASSYRDPVKGSMPIRGMIVRKL